MSDQIFFSSQVKLSVIITYKLPHGLTNDLRLRILRHIKKISTKYQENLKTSQNYSLVLSCPPPKKNKKIKNKK